MTIQLALHGGAGANPDHDYSVIRGHMLAVAEVGRDQLRNGEPALEVVTKAVASLEASGLYIAGRGASPNLRGQYELDACLMDGASGLAGAVGALQGFQSAVTAARAVMACTPHVFLVGDGAAAFAREQNLAEVVEPEKWFTNAAQWEFNRLPVSSDHGTVGCVARDMRGNFAAATSTAGVFGKRPGRVGDSALIGASTWADEEIAVSCTGQGEFFIRAAAAVQIAYRRRFGAQSLSEAVRAVLADIAARGGSGGVVAIDRLGAVSVEHCSSGMKSAVLMDDGSVIAQAP